MWYSVFPNTTLPKVLSTLGRGAINHPAQFGFETLLRGIKKPGKIKRSD